MTQIDSLPVTKVKVAPKRAHAIKQAVRTAENMATDNHISRLATPDDAALFFRFLSDPAVSAPIYTLPTQLSEASVREFIESFCAGRETGTELLFLNFNEAGQLGGYTDVTVWPDYAAGELGGAVHPNRQGQRRGIAGAEMGFTWMFDTLDLDTICETAALDNVRTARLLDTLGFRRVGQTVSKYDDGRSRDSLVWEVTKDEWMALTKN